MIQLNDHGRFVDTQRHEAPRFPFAPGTIEGPHPEPRSIFASKAFWLAGALSLGCWTALVLWLLHR